MPSNLEFRLKFERSLDDAFAEVDALSRTYYGLKLLTSLMESSVKDFDLNGETELDLIGLSSLLSLSISSFQMDLDQIKTRFKHLEQILMDL